MKYVYVCILLFFIFLAGGCATEKRNSERNAFEGSKVTVETYDGYAGKGKIVKQTFEKVPKRILAVSESTIDNLIFLGVEDKIVAVADCDQKVRDTYKKSFYSLTNGHGYPSKEAVLNLKPDIIVSWGSLFGESVLGSVKYWHEKGIHTYLLSNTVPVVPDQSSNNAKLTQRNVDNILLDLKNLSHIFRIDNQSEEKIAFLEKRINNLKNCANKIPNNKKPKVLTIQNVYGNEYFGRSSRDMTTDVVKIAGGVSLDDEVGGKKSIEHLIQKNPDIIMIVDMPSRPGKAKIEALKKNPLLQRVTAVKNDNFFLIPYRAFYGGSVYTIQAAEDLNTFITKRF